MASPEGTTWVFDCPLMDDLAVAADFAAAPAGGFFWAAPPSLQPQAPVQSVVAASAPNPCPRSESTTESSTKASREKIRRDKLNERFLELGAILEPGKTPKMDKTAILSDAIRVVGELRSEAKKLKDSNENLQEKIKELKAEKNELRDEKQRLKAEKESLEQQIKFLNARPSLVPHHPVIPASAFPAPQGPAAAARHKLMMPVIGYPGFPMWQFMPPSDVDTSDDPRSCPPVA
ncbi:Transcription factor ILR3 [Zea mays]|uniref:Transcription factor ILR3 n=1 Tax=Zea mays TaxID=4577 RepID=A0A1D6IE48_MAIZE|nr:Transcription factor ILR3 [Zea mays]